jgi:hypothetical protein
MTLPLVLCCLVVRLSADQYQDFTYTNNGIATTITDYTGSGGAVTIPDTIPPGSWTRVTGIGPSAFEMCSGLTSVTIPRSVTNIGYRAFAYCGLASVTFLADGLTSIGDEAFWFCNSLTSMTLPASVKSIGAMAFYGVGLTNVTLPPGVTNIGGGAFSGCSRLTCVVFLGDAPTLGEPAVFDNPATGFTIYYFNGKAGFSSPLWNGYPAVNVGEPTPLKTWLLENGLPPDSSLQDDPNHDGVNLLIAYALDLNPQLDLSGRMPRPMLAGNQMSLTFHAGAAGVSYFVETSTDLKTWSPTGVRISDPDANMFRTATVDMAGTGRFLRLVVSHTD